MTFTKEDAVQFGLNNKEDFAALTRKVVIKMAQIKNIPLQDVCWGGFYHVNTDNPHVHFYFYDKRNPNDSRLFPREKIANIRAVIAREVVDRAELLNNKEIASMNLLKNTRSILNDELLIKELEKYEARRTADTERFIHPRYSLNQDFFKQLLHLDEVLPKEGRLSYNAHNMEPYLSEIDKMIAIMFQQKGMKEDLKVYKDLLMKVYQSNMELYGEDKRQGDYLEHQMERVYASLGNAVLKMIKSYRSSREDDPDIRFSRFLPSSETRRISRKLIKPFGHDLIRYSIHTLSHEISMMRSMMRLRERERLQMARAADKERDEVEHESI